MPSRHSSEPCQRYSLLLAFLLAAALPGVGHADPSLVVTAIHPNAASPGEEVAISGQGLQGSAPQFYAWVDTNDSGFAMSLQRVGDSAIMGTVGEVATPATGTVKVWRGYGHPLADRTLWTQGQLISLLDTQVFVAQERASGPVFSAVESSRQTLGSRVLSGQIRTDLQGFDPDPGNPSPTVTVSAVIETGGSPGGGTGNGHVTLSPARDKSELRNSTSAPAWAMSFTIESDALPLSNDALAAAVAELMQQQFGSLGLQASSEGSELVLDHPYGIGSGFVTLSY